MCYAGGPYCDKTAQKRLRRAENDYQKNPSQDNFESRKRAQRDYDGTPAGQQELQALIDSENNENKIQTLRLRKERSFEERERAKARAKAEGRAVPPLTLTHGLPASGKSTWAEEREKEDSRYVRVNRDDLREELFGEDYNLKGLHNPKDEDHVSSVQRRRVEQAFEEGRFPIIDDTNLNTKTVKTWFKVAKEHGAELKHVYFDVELDELKRRNSQRRRVVADKVYGFMSAGIREDGKTVKRFRFNDKGHIIQE